MQTSSKISAGIVIVVVIAAFVYWFDNQSKVVTQTPTNLPAENSGNSNTGNSNTTPTPTPTPKPVTSSVYKNGTYSSTVTYMAPPGNEKMGVTVTIANDKITSVNVQNMATDQTSSMYQNRFIGSVSSTVVGQSVNQMKLGVVSGASLSTNAFNNALVQIKAQAKL